ncbi:transglycosylase SLT domain-containing protein [Nocardia sp. CDC159]|uniref:Transglycosylase SLT domain-containing protein n=1 Tax=Nocardia pulmonis TaxID=2951408 RepID=A0A9X2IWL6_9NOCA|nr:MULTISPECIES: transglycosylase SLT domain-containing protein [Nocardia]MCM6775057.1 transglycosylase SLT domain-containing protein [Nocardia pulmonis]MCM6789527.1 transglycosylase SLT domain-containing protein [Nocardia sp. CDC159]
MTLTIPDVEKWNPSQLSTAAAAITTLSADLDRAVNKGCTDTQQLRTDSRWSGQVADVAENRMTTEKTRASAVSQALLELRGALSQQVENLQHTKDEVLKLRNLAENAPAPPGPFEVAANGTVTAEARKAWLRDNLPDGTPGKTEMLLHQDIEAGQRTLDLTRALSQAESVATTASAAVDAARAKLESATTALGDPVTGVTNPAPVATAPAAVSPAAGAPVSNASPRLVGSVPHNGGSGGYQGGGSGASGFGFHGGTGLSGTEFSALSSGSSGGPVGPMPTGTQAEWIREAIRILREQGYAINDSDAAIIAAIIEHESGGNPQAINLWDSNAAAGTPSKGLMQTIDSTFNSYAIAGHHDIWNPVDNIIAGTRYAIDRYGSLDNVPGIAAMRGGGSYVGY